MLYSNAVDLEERSAKIFQPAGETGTVLKRVISGLQTIGS